MPSHKVLKSVVTSVAQSFTSLLNYGEEGYVMDHIVRTAWETGATGFIADLLSGKTDSSPLMVKPVVDSIKIYIKRLPEIVIRSGSSIDFITSAELIFSIDPTKKRRAHGHVFTKDRESPFNCTVNIKDDRGKLYTHTVEGWWYS